MTLERLRTAPLSGLMDPRECEALARLAADVPREQAIIEIGSYRGLSSAWLAAGANGARVTCIDIWPQPSRHERDREHAERQRGALSAFLAVQADLGWPVSALRAGATDVAAMWLQPVGLLFHDADHSYEAVKRDVLAWLPHLAADGVLALHDYLGDDMAPTDVARVVEDMGWRTIDVVEKLWIGRR